MCSSEDHSHRRGQWGHYVGLVSAVFLELQADRAPASYSADRNTQTLPHSILYTGLYHAQCTSLGPGLEMGPRGDSEEITPLYSIKDHNKNSKDSLTTSH